MSKELFFDMKAQEVADIYSKPITKKESQQLGKTLIKGAIAEGNIIPHELMSQICRLKEVINAADTELRQHLPHEPYESYGVTFTPVNGGSTIDYKDDELWRELKVKLSDREQLLKVAQKSSDIIFDSDGIEVPKVGSTPRKSSITIKF